jgi:hypothetical protein
MSTRNVSQLHIAGVSNMYQIFVRILCILCLNLLTDNTPASRLASVIYNCVESLNIMFLYSKFCTFEVLFIIPLFL